MEPIQITIAGDEAKLRMLARAYESGQPVATDEEFDELWRQHVAHRAEFPEDATWQDTILDRVGANSSGDVAHLTPMLSLDNVFEQDSAAACDRYIELLAWVAASATEDIVIEPKYDGMASSLIVQKGSPNKAVTRGDGLLGKDITQRAEMCDWRADGCPLSKFFELIDAYAGVAEATSIELRGEMAVTAHDFARLNHHRESLGLDRYSNPRNCVPGILLGKDPADAVFAQYISFVPHGVVINGHTGSSAQFQHIVSALGLRNYQVVLSGNITPVSVSEAISHVRSATDYPLDGAVIKVCDKRDEMGSTQRAPRWAVALKFLQEKVITTVESITVQVGRTGALTPVAIVTPTTIDGTVITRVTLANEDVVNSKGLYVGAKVLLQRAGGVIPEIVGLAPGAPPAEAQWSLYDHVGGRCPSCGSEIQKVGSAWTCVNDACPAKAARRFLHIAKQEAFDIEAMGDEIASALADVTGGDELALFTYSVSELAGVRIEDESGGVTTVGQARATKIRNSLLDATRLPLDRWLIAMGIPKVGRTAGREIARVAQTLEQALDPEGPIGARRYDKNAYAHMKINSAVGAVVCNALFDFFVTPRGQAWRAWMLPFGIVSDCYAPVPPEATGAFAGKSVVITGTLKEARPHYEALITKNGGKVGSGVSKKTDYLLVGDDAGSKLKKAQELGVTILDEVQFNAMLA